MKVAVAGGGPAGLYFALLLADDREHQVTVFERNPEGATYGWGVVFSEGTLANLAGDHQGLIDDLDRLLIRWSTIFIHGPEGTIRAAGQPFTALNRRGLLEALNRRAGAAGVEIEHESVFQPGDESGFDLVVAADGVNSVWRRSRPSFRSSEHAHPTRYIWLGLTSSLPGFTFIFHPTPHGVFQVHAYPYGPDESTFIVETTDQAFTASGLEGADEKSSVDFCQELFADHLGGAELLSNHSQWLRFLTLRNRRWFDLDQVPVVLIGDAAHTAHFSIGSGTKLAMEDAAALAQALIDDPDDLAAALANYQAVRQPPVARFQQAATDSARYFEGIGGLLSLPPATFAINLLTRSGRVGFSDVERGDPALAARAGLAPALQPITIRGARFQHRLLGGELGLSVSPVLPVNKTGRRYRDQPLAGAVTDRWDVTVLGHAGSRASARLPEDGLDRPLRHGGWSTVAATAIPYTKAHPTPRAITEDEMTQVAEDFATAARRFNGETKLLLIDGAQGGLLGSFISPLTNSNGFDSLDFPQAVVEAVRSEWDGPLGFRLSVTDLAPGGISLEQAVSAARRLLSSGVDLIEVCGPGAVSSFDWPERPDYLLPLALQLRLETGGLVMVGAGITTLDGANTAIGSGRADLIRLGNLIGLGRFDFDLVLEAEGAGPLVGVGVDEVEFPAAFVFGAVVVFTEGVEVVVVGGSAVYPALAVVEVGVDRGGATAGEDTVGVAGFDSSSLAAGGSSTGGAVGDDLVVVYYMPAPFGVLLLGYLAGDVGEDGSPSGDLPRCVV